MDHISNKNYQASDYFEQAEKYYSENNFANAFQALNKGISEDNNNIWAHAMRAILLQNLQRYRESISEYRLALELFKSRRGELSTQNEIDNYTEDYLYEELGSVLWLLSEREKSKVYREESLYAYERAIAINPQNIAALYGVGESKASLGEVRGAIDALEKCISLDPYYGRPYRSLYHLFFKCGKFKKAFQIIMKFANIFPHMHTSVKDPTEVLQ